MISKKATDLIIQHEVGGRAYYDKKLQAPIWMQRSGLEWFFRLMCEPKRLWKRYLIGNLRFIYFVLKDIFKGVL